MTRFSYDKLGRLTAITDALNQITQYGYDEQGNRISQIDANGHATSFEYDQLGRQTKRNLPGGATETFTYDAIGNRRTRTDFNGVTTIYTYDVSSRLLSRNYPDGTLVTFTYTPTGRRASVTDARGTTTYAYDHRDRLKLLTYPDGRLLSYDYDSQGNRRSLTAQIGSVTRTTGYGYDALNRLETVTDPDGRIYTYTYDSNGNRASLSYPNGITTTYSYDALNRLANLASKTRDGSVIQSYTYLLGPAGNRLRVDEQDGTSRSYSYDDLYRLNDEHVTRNGSTVFRNSFVYDPVGNRISQAKAQGINPAVSINYTYDDRDRLIQEGDISYDSDNNGNQRSKSGAAGATYTWDYENRLTRLALTNGTIVEHVYDADGNRIKTSVRSGTGIHETEYLVDPQWQIGTNERAESLSQAVLVVDSVSGVESYVRGNELLGVIRSSTLRFYLTEGDSTVRFLTDESGAVTDRYQFEVFGSLRQHVGSDPNLFLFTGEWLEPNSGFQYNRARWLSPSLGRFISSDPLWPSFSEPRLLHQYVYASGDPANRYDASGLFEINLASVLYSATISGLINAAIAATISVITGKTDDVLVTVSEAFFTGFALGALGEVLLEAAAVGRVLTAAERGRTGQAAVVNVLKSSGEEILHENLWYTVETGTRIRGEIDILSRGALHEVKNYVWSEYNDFLLEKVEERFLRQIANRRAFLAAVRGAEGFPETTDIVFWLSRGAPQRIIEFLENQGIVVRLFTP